MSYDNEIRQSGSLTVDTSDGNGGAAGIAITVNLTDRDEPIQVTAGFARLRENPQNGKVDLVCSRLLPEDGDPSRGRTPSGAGRPGSVVIETERGSAADARPCAWSIRWTPSTPFLRVSCQPRRFQVPRSERL